MISNSLKNIMVMYCFMGEELEKKFVNTQLLHSMMDSDTQTFYSINIIDSACHCKEASAAYYFCYYGNINIGRTYMYFFLS